MDESVIRALARWPNVPAVFGWMSLNARGQWLIKGEQITNQQAKRFINRNYQCDAQGRWYFQNGPQQVFVLLHETPWILHLGLEGAFAYTHTGEAVSEITRCFMDDDGGVLLDFQHGIGRVDDRDLGILARALCGPAGEQLHEDIIAERIENLVSGEVVELALLLDEQLLPLTFVRKAAIAEQFNFVPDPRLDPQ